MAVRQWDRDNKARYGTVVASVVLNSGDTTANIEIPDYADKTIHIFGGTFGDGTVSVLGLNSASGTGQALHRVNDSSLTFSTVSAELLALLLENPRYITVTAAGTTGTGLTVVIVGKRNI